MTNNKREAVAVLEYLLSYGDYIGFTENQILKIAAIKDCMNRNPNTIRDAIRGGRLVFEITYKPVKHVECFINPSAMDEYKLRLAELKREEVEIEKKKEVLSKNLTDDNITEINVLNIRLYNIERHRMDLYNRMKKRPVNF